MKPIKAWAALFDGELVKRVDGTLDIFSSRSAAKAGYRYSKPKVVRVEIRELKPRRKGK